MAMSWVAELAFLMQNKSGTENSSEHHLTSVVDAIETVAGDYSGAITNKSSQQNSLLFPQLSIVTNSMSDSTNKRKRTIFKFLKQEFLITLDKVMKEGCIPPSDPTEIEL